MINKQTGLKACPFCGGYAISRKIESNDGTFVIVECQICRAETDQYVFAGSAIEAWNNRYDEQDERN